MRSWQRLANRYRPNMKWSADYDNFLKYSKQMLEDLSVYKLSLKDNPRGSPLAESTTFLPGTCLDVGQGNENMPTATIPREVTRESIKLRMEKLQKRMSDKMSIIFEQDGDDIEKLGAEEVKRPSSLKSRKAKLRKVCFPTSLNPSHL